MSKHNTNRNRGAAIITAVMFFVVITVAIAVGISSPVVREYKTSRDFEKSKGAYYLSEAGHEDALYRLKEGITIGAQEVISIGGNIATTTITDVGGGKSIGSIGDILTNTRRVASVLTTTNTASFGSGVEAGDGGVVMLHSAVINGNLFSNGPIVGNGNWIMGAVVSASSTIASITNIQSSGSMYASTIAGSTITGAGLMYCNTISGSSPNTCTAASTSTPGTLQWTQDEIAKFEADAEAGGVIVCTSTNYVVTGTENLGPVKIVGTAGSNCNLDVNANATVNLLGPVWVVGDIEFKSSNSGSSAVINISPTLSGKSVMIIADNPADRINKSTVTVEDKVAFNGAGIGSYVALLGQNNGASQSPSQATNAVLIKDQVLGSLLVYSGLGNVLIKGQAALKQVSGYKITLQDTANITYDSGLANVVFESGPGGGWVISDWKEGQ